MIQSNLLKRIAIPVFKFDSQKNEWLRVEQENHNNILETNNIFKCLTYNVWFEQHNFQLRVEELLKIFSESKSDFICLQEVIPQFQYALSNNKYIRDNYYLSGNNIGGYGVMILQRPKPSQMYEIAFPSKMSRSLLVSHSVMNGKSIIISTSHLESLSPNANYRKSQMEIAYKLFEDYEDVLMMGDFNFDNPQENQTNINDLSNDTFQDVWLSLNPNSEGHTMKKTARFKSWRPDRVIIKSKHLQAQTIQVVGDYNIPLYEKQQSSSEVMTPSDHLGLIVCTQII